MLQDQHLLVPSLGLVGDALTFLGGFILAWDAAREAKHFKEVRRTVETLSSQELVRLRVEIGGIVISNEKDVELSFILRSAKKAFIGAVILTIGFGFLLAARLLEISWP
jgi:hypothetical protein